MGFYCEMIANVNAYSCMMAGLWRMQSVARLSLAGLLQLYFVLEVDLPLDIKTLDFYLRLFYFSE